MTDCLLKLVRTLAIETGWCTSLTNRYDSKIFSLLLKVLLVRTIAPIVVEG